MRAIRHHQFGDPEVLRLEEAPDPVPAPGQLLVRVAAAGIAYADVQYRSGALRRYGWLPEPDFPTIPGWEVAGTVIAAGPDTPDDLVGHRVVSMTAGGGGYAELALVPAARATPLPDGVSEQVAVTLLTQGRTALGVVELAALTGGETVLVEAAGGGIGSQVVQLARRAGAGTVVAAARGAAKLALARDLGADLVVDYGQPDWTEQVRAGLDGRPVDVVFETVGGTIARQAFELLDGGRIVIYGIASGDLPDYGFTELLRTGVAVLPYQGLKLERTPRAATIVGELLDLVVSGELRPVVGQVLPLAEAAAAHRAFEDRTAVGKTVLVP